MSDVSCSFLASIHNNWITTIHLDFCYFFSLLRWKLQGWITFLLIVCMCTIVLWSCAISNVCMQETHLAKKEKKLIIEY